MDIGAQRNSGPVLLLSGGLDSAVTLAHLQASGERNITAITFDYNQTNRANELAAARKLAQYYGVAHRIVGLGSIFINSSLTGHIEDIPEQPAIDGPDSTFVPGRNAVLIAIGVAIAQASGSTTVVSGCNHDDAAGYPDTSPMFMWFLKEAMTTGYGVSISNPLLYASKPDILQLAKKYEVPVQMTWSCYRGGTTPCGRCGSCAMNRVAL